MVQIDKAHKTPAGTPETQFETFGLRRAAAKVWYWACLYCLAYIIAGLWLDRVGAYDHPNLLFDADPSRVAEDLTRFRDANHYRTSVHPLFVLATNPVGVVSRKAVKTLLNLVGHSGAETYASETSVVMVSLMGGLAFILAYWFFQRAGLRHGEGLLWSHLLALSSTNTLFGAMPETYVFAEASMIVLLLTRQQLGGEGLGQTVVSRWHAAPSLSAELSWPAGFWRFVAAGIFSLAICVTNFIQGLVIFVSALRWRRGERRASLALLVIFAAFILHASVSLSVVQKVIYPSSLFFFQPNSMLGEKPYVAVPTPARAARLAAHMGLYSIVAPSLLLAPADPNQVGDIGTIDFRTRPSYGIAGTVACVMWLSLLLWAGYSLIQDRRWRQPVIAGLIGCLAFNFALHCIYGDCLFLYSGNWIFAVLALTALSLPRNPGAGGFAARRIYLLLMSLLVVCIAVNNITFMRRLISLSKAVTRGVPLGHNVFNPSDSRSSLRAGLDGSTSGPRMTRPVPCCSAQWRGQPNGRFRSCGFYRQASPPMRLIADW